MFHMRSKECTVFFLHRIYLEVERHQDGFVSLRKLQFGMDDSFIEVLTLLHVICKGTSANPSDLIDSTELDT